MPELMEHGISPVYNKESTILILGSFPSVKSREGQFFYHHPQNRFWRVLAAVYSETVPQTIEDKKKFLLRNRIAVWDVIKSCEITGSSDSSIRNVVQNDLSIILQSANIRALFANGNKSFELYNRYCKAATGYDIIKLPSTSPANAAYTLDRLVEAWRVIYEEQ